MATYTRVIKLIKDVFLGLYILQLLNYIAPIIIIPVLIKQIGISSYGELIYITAVYQIVSLFIDFGFTYTAPVVAAKIRNDASKLQEYYSLISILKAIIYILSILVLSGLILCDLIQLNYYYYISILLCCLGNVFTPLWLFQGVGNFKFLSVSQIKARMLLFIFLILYLFCGGKNLFIISVLQNGYLLICYLFMRKRLPSVRLKYLTISASKIELKKAGNVFVGVLGTIGYGGLIPILIGNYCGHVSLGVYSIVQKITAACQSLISPISQYMLSEVSQSSQKNTFFKNKIKKSIYIHFLISSAACVCYVIFGQFAAKVIGKIDVDFSIILLASVITIFSSLNNVLGIQFLIPTNNENLLKSVNLLSGVIVALLSSYLIVNYNVLGGVMLNVLGEGLVFILLTVIAIKKWREGVVNEN
ncbi:oligosaccharide flippase family protein [Salmonella enterica]|nr:oligosaccharide flippase family protein [Salmonella enterica]